KEDIADMSFDIKRVDKSVRRVRKFLRKNSSSPSADAVHNVRTSARSLETSLTTLGLDSKRKVRRLLRKLAKVRKGGGKLRDMDVLTGDALGTKQGGGEQDCLVRLLEYLGAEREKYARKLHLVIEQAGPQLRKDLKGSAKRLEKALKR